jgi:chromosome segregation ATPase
VSALVTDDLRERLVRLETEMKHATQKLDDMSAQVNRLVSLMNQGKGAQWILVAIAGVIGTVGGAVGSFMALLKH